MRSFDQELNELEAAHLRRHLRVLESPAQGPVSRTQAVINGQPCINFASNDYLGLAESPQVAAWLHEGIDLWGAGAAASRLVTGTMTPHHSLEAIIAQFKGTESAVAFGSGYAAAVGTLSAVLKKGDVVIIDKLAHASLIDGARLSEATIRVFHHNDPESLEKRLRWAVEHVPQDGRLLVVTEAVFSMDGDRAPLTEIVQLTERYGALLLVDEAHSLGLFGPGGRGLVAALGLTDRVAFHFGTLSKAVGLSGGYVAGTRQAMQLIINRARSLIYSTAPAPAIAFAAGRVLETLLPGTEGEGRRSALFHRINRLAQEGSEAASLAPWAQKEPPSAILPVVLGDEALTLQAAQHLMEEGFLVPAIRYPTVARQQARLRITVSAAHKEADIERMVHILKELNLLH